MSDKQLKYFSGFASLMFLLFALGSISSIIYVLYVSPDMVFQLLYRLIFYFILWSLSFILLGGFFILFKELQGRIYGYLKRRDERNIDEY